MKQLAPYIQHFREAFRGKKEEDRALKPFDGRLFRHMHLDDVIVQKYQKDSKRLRGCVAHFLFLHL